MFTTYDFTMGVRDAQIFYDGLKLLTDTLAKKADTLTKEEKRDFKDATIELQYMTELCIFENNKIIGFHKER